MDHTQEWADMLRQQKTRGHRRKQKDETVLWSELAYLTQKLILHTETPLAPEEFFSTIARITRIRTRLILLAKQQQQSDTHLARLSTSEMKQIAKETSTFVYRVLTA